MARKNLLAGLTDPKLTAVNTSEPDQAQPAPQAGAGEARPARTPPLSFAGRGALGAVARSIDALGAQAGAARALEARLQSGDVVASLETSLIDPSPVADRMAQDDEQYRALLDAMRDGGQDTPILVRPHPTAPGRYQVAFGHRRLRAATELGRPVRAVVRKLADEELVVAQGQENSARADLSFIERARFAHRLEQAGHDRGVIMRALSVDKTTVSRLVSVAAGLPEAVIDAIGPAPQVGRDRWLDLLATAGEAGEGALAAAIAGPAMLSADTNARFDLVLRALARPPAAAEPAAPQPEKRLRARGQTRYWRRADGVRVAKLTENDAAFVIAIDQQAAPGFGEFLAGEMDRLHARYLKDRKA